MNDPKTSICMHCGAAVNLSKCWYVNYDNASSEFIAPEAEPEHGQYGVLPLGTGCAKKLVREGKLKASFIIME